MERGMDLVIRREFKLVRGRLRAGPDDFEWSDITIEELCAFSLFLDLDAYILGAKINGIIDLIFGVRSSMFICLCGLSRLRHDVSILRECYGFVDAF